MKCPLFSISNSDDTDCLEAGCAWYHNLGSTEGQCFVISMANDMGNIFDRMTQLDNEISIIADKVKRH
jgi:hypothetical protein